MRKSSTKHWLKSFQHAFQGLLVFFKEEANARIHATVAVLVIAAGFLLHLSALEWLAIIMAIGLVLVTELINTAIENLADHVTPQQHPQIKRVKDIAAGAVLASTFTALAVAIVVFGDKLIQLVMWE